MFATHFKGGGSSLKVVTSDDEAGKKRGSQ